MIYGGDDVNESGPITRGDNLDRAIQSFTLLLSNIKSAGLPPCICSMRDLHTRAPEGTRWLSTQILYPIQTPTLNHENLVLRKQLLAIETAREDSGLIRTGSLGSSRKDISAELEVIEDLIADACASFSWFSWVLDFKLQIRCFQLASTLYRSLVLAIYGPHALHKVELVAYNSLVSEPLFDTHFFAGRTASLLDYICHMLEPLLDFEPKQLDGNELGISDSTPPGLFEDVMKHTIQLAAKLCLTDRRCLWKSLPPGSNFDP
ncbi:hypothetical protein PGQ11_010185 [Apiospora arundinis]|uniref:Uncharacterized protein n=1 Tax=Apiospora arundinis TaxID=335852 RepID=A0ABR2I9H5_9PEZI